MNVADPRAVPQLDDNQHHHVAQAPLPDQFLLEAGLARQVELSGGDGRPMPLSSLLARPAVVLLGDPGLGKSVSIRATAAAAGVVPQTVRSFLARGARSQQTGPVFLDALDEVMAAHRNDTPLDEVVQLLHFAGWPRFWLSCRPADWAQAGGRTLLEECVPGGLAVAHLLPLSEGEIAAVIDANGLDHDAVVRGMEAAALLPLLGNPETLRLTLKIFAEGGPPASRTDLYRRATAHLAREVNKAHARRPDRPTEEQLLAAASAVSALLLMSGRSAVAAPGAEAEHAVPMEVLTNLVPREHIEAALGSRLFRQSGDETWEPAHRTIAEFLGAGFLARRISQCGQPLGRMLALLCGDDLAPEPSLRGLFAWLAALLPDRAVEFVGRDPYAVATFGDLSSLRSDGRHALVAGLRRLVETEPFFRAGRWGEARFGALAAPDLVPELRKIIATRPVREHLLSCVLDALEDGEPRPELVPDLVALITDVGVDLDGRKGAVAAFVRAASEAEAAALFGRLLRDNAADPRAHLAGSLLLRLYPKVLDENDAAAFLDRFVSTDAGHGDRLHLDYRLLPLVPAGHEARLLDRLSAYEWVSWQSHPMTRLSEVKQIARNLAARALAAQDPAPAVRVVAWLPLLAKDGEGTKDAGELQAALAARADLYIPFLLAVWSAEENPTGYRPWYAPSRLRRVLPWFDPPHDAADRALDEVEADPDGEAAVLLYASALALMLGAPDAGASTFERAWAVGDLRPALKRERDDLLFCLCEGQDWRREDREQCARQAREEAEAEAQNAAFFEEHQDAIRAGAHVAALSWLATRWFGIFPRAEGAIPSDPREQLRLVVPPHIAEAAEAGFRAYAAVGPLLDPAVLVRQIIENRHPHIDYAALAGADLIFRDAGRLTGSLAADRCTGLLCLGLVRPTHTTIDRVIHTDERPWLRHIAETLPEESERAVRELLMRQIERHSEFVGGLHEICSQKGFEAIRRRLVPELLAVVHAPGSAFDTLRRAAAKECDPATFGAIVRARLRGAESSSLAERWPWLLLAWRLAPADHEQALKDAIREDEDILSALMDEILGDPEPFPGNVLWLSFTLRHRDFIVRIAGPRFPPVPVPEGSWSPPTPYDRARLVQRQIAGIGDTAGPDAEVALRSLLVEPDLAPHANHILHALSTWRRNARLEKREMPALQPLARSLADGPPATTAELHAFVVAHLEGLRDTLRVTSDNAWRAFWNVEAKAGATEARPENDCRDAVKRFLDARFERAGLAQETEARFVGDTRCDITVGSIRAVVPIEVKCDWNPQLWTAWRDQLQAQYACDPRTEGFGIYLVIWFGEQRGKKRRVTSPPAGVPRPISAAECQKLLNELTAEHADRLVTIVIDTSPV